jgi:hypothetical protein
MPLTDEVRAQIAAFADGSLSARELTGWLDSVAPELHSAGHEHLRRLVGEVYVVLAELGYGDRTAENARSEVAQLTSRISTGPAPRAEKSASLGTGSPSL